MMALAALSMAVQNGTQNADALEHYQQVIPALKIIVQSSQDSYSDGALFTHFILLLYEVCSKTPFIPVSILDCGAMGQLVKPCLSCIACYSCSISSNMLKIAAAGHKEHNMWQHHRSVVTVHKLPLKCSILSLYEKRPTSKNCHSATTSARGGSI